MNNRTLGLVIIVVIAITAALLINFPQIGLWLLIVGLGASLGLGIAAGIWRGLRRGKKKRG